jgi:hypothetical protein
MLNIIFWIQLTFLSTAFVDRMTRNKNSKDLKLEPNYQLNCCHYNLVKLIEETSTIIQKL